MYALISPLRYPCFDIKSAIKVAKQFIYFNTAFLKLTYDTTIKVHVKFALRRFSSELQELLSERTRKKQNWAGILDKLEQYTKR